VAYRGKFYPKNRNKYKGDPDNIVFRSLWERRVMVDLDENPNVISWGSEEVIIPYYDPIADKNRRYFPDFVFKVRDRQGNIRTILMEVKPLKETKPPVSPKRKTKRYLTEGATYVTNEAKWAAARQVCAQMGWEFKIATEEHIFPPKKSNK
jgi:hypothetical protein